MLIAHDSLKNRIHIRDAKKGQLYYCPICRCELIQKRGNIRSHHFAHLPDKDGNHNNCYLNYYAGMTEWHSEWQNRFGKDNMEIILENDNQKHIADIIINNVVIEFQHSNLTIEEFRNRNDFYTSLGYKVIWIFDLIDEYQSGKIINDPFYNNQNEFQWARPKKFFKELNVKNEKCQIYFQLSNDENLCVLERVTKNTWDFKTFYTDNKKIFSIEEFVNNANCNIDDLFYTPKQTKETVKTIKEIQNGKTILELWRNNTRWLIIENLKTNEIYKLYYDPRSDIRTYDMVFGNIASGKYYDNNKGYRYSFNKNKVRLFDWDKPYWKVLKKINAENGLITSNETKGKKTNDAVKQTINEIPPKETIRINDFPNGKTIKQLLNENPNKLILHIRCLVDDACYYLDFYNNVITPYHLNLTSRHQKEASKNSSYYKYLDEAVWALL